MKTPTFYLMAIFCWSLGATEKEIWYDYQGKPVLQTVKHASNATATQPKDLVSAQPTNLQKISPMPWSRSPRYRSDSSRYTFGFFPQFGWISYDCYRPNHTPSGSGLQGWHQSNGQWGINYQAPGFSLQWSR